MRALQGRPHLILIMELGRESRPAHFLVDSGMADIATRVYNHTWKIDPIVRSVIDTDFYKLLMAQTIWKRHRNVNVTFGIHNRTTRVRLADMVDVGELREQLDHCRTLSLTRGESTWLRGNTFYGKRQMFAPEFIAWLETFRFPDYHLETRDGQYVLTFHGPWVETTMWEIPALAILNELRSRRSEEHTSELQSRQYLVCRLLLEKKK